MTPRSPVLRVLLATLAGFLFTMFAICAAYTWQESKAQLWGELGYGWLSFDAWARAWEVKEAFAGAILTFGLAIIAEFTTKRASPVLRLIGWGERFAAHPATVGMLLALTFGLPRLAANISKPTPPAEAKNLLYVMVDTWRADHVGWLGYERPVTPKLDQLVRSGVVCERAISASGWTKPSVATQLTGLLPSIHGAVSQPVRRPDGSQVPVNGTMLPPGVTTWIETLRGRGWETAMFSANPNILPSHGFDQGASHFVDYVNHPENTDGFDHGRAEHMLPDVREWIDAQATEGGRFAAYVHLMDPHYPFVAPAPFKGTFDKTGLDFQLDGIICGQWVNGELNRDDIGERELERIKAIYDEEILYTDYYLAPFIKGIQRDYPDTVVVLISDHGEEFLEHGQLGHGQSVYAELVNVPLVIWAPQLEPDRIPWQVRSLDVLPTLIELVGTIRSEKDLPLLGSSLLDIEDGHRLALMESGGDERPPWHWRSVSDGEYKMIQRLENRPDMTETQDQIPVLDPRETENGNYMLLYQLSTDRAETTDLFELDKTRARRLRSLGEDQIRSLHTQLDWFGTEHIYKLGTKSGGLGADADQLAKLGYADLEDQ
ncbi:MAG: sulfatase [Planctomycetes bacterium]|nr:sulfatase [Planctomycetota bacterium]